MSNPAPTMLGQDKPKPRTPMLGLSIPSPDNDSGAPIIPAKNKRSLGPALSIIPGIGGSPAPLGSGRKLPGLSLQVATPASGPTLDTLGRSSLSLQPGRPSEPTSSQGEKSALDESDDDMPLPDLEKLSLEKGRPLDIQDLTDRGLKAAKAEHKIIELGSLGEGAGGAVTKCVLKGGKTVFALKVITADPNPDVKRQMRRELDFNKECNSPYICQYFGAFADHDAGNIFIAMEFCEGGSLDNVYREIKRLGGRCGEKPLGKVAEGVLSGLTYLSKRNIIHRDIKPSNVLLCRDGQVKLCDFGVSGEIGSKGGASTFIGTSYYMAPERITGQSYTITSDVWSLGVTLLEVASHKFPFTAPDGSKAGLIDLLSCIVRQPIPKLLDEPENKIKWSLNFKSFIDDCLEKDAVIRATPWDMLKHPWIVEIKNKRVNMEHFLKLVWNWEDPVAT